MNCSKKYHKMRLDLFLTNLRGPLVKIFGIFYHASNYLQRAGWTQASQVEESLKFYFLSKLDRIETVFASIFLYLLTN